MANRKHQTRAEAARKAAALGLHVSPAMSRDQLRVAIDRHHNYQERVHRFAPRMPYMAYEGGPRPSTTFCMEGRHYHAVYYHDGTLIGCREIEGD